MGKSYKRNDGLMIDSSAIAVDSNGTPLSDLDIATKPYIADIQVVSGPWSDTITINASSSISTANYVTVPDTPTGYSVLFSWIETSGNGSVGPTNINSVWIFNASNSQVSNVRVKYNKCCIKTIT